MPISCVELAREFEEDLGEAASANDDGQEEGEEEPARKPCIEEFLQYQLVPELSHIPPVALLVDAV